MRCDRCHGLLVEDHCYDLYANEICMKAWRCIACGNIVDDVIRRNRVKQQPRYVVAEPLVVEASAA